MDFSNGFTLIEYLKKFSFSTNEIPYMLKVLQQTHDKKIIPHWFQTLDNARQAQFIRLAVECYFHVISSAKLARGFFKILLDLPKKDQELIQRELEISFETLVNDATIESIKKLCELLNVSPTAKEACKKFILPTSSLVVQKLSLFIQTGTEIKDRQNYDMLYYAMKTCSETFKKCFFITDVNCPITTNDLKSLWSKTFHCLLSLLFQDTSQELLGLTCTAISMLLNLSPSLTESSIAYKMIFKLIFAENEIPTIFNTSFKKPSTHLSDEDKNLCALMLTKGLLLTSSKELLCCDNTDEQPFLFFLFPFILKPCRGPQINHYIAFQVLTLWFQKLKAIGIKSFAKQSDNQDESKDLNQSHNEITDDKKDSVSESVQLFDSRCIMSSSCPVLTSTLSTIWLNWESPVDGVSEYVTTIFDSILNIWAQAIKDKISKYSELSRLLMERLLIMSWHTKTRYRPLSILLSYVDVFQLLHEHPELKEDLIKCMGVNSLAAVASDVYKGFLTQIKVQAASENKDVLCKWCDLWMPTLISGISSSNPIQRLKICTYWIPHSLKIIQGSEVALLDTLQNRINNKDQGSRIKQLLTWTTVCRYSRDILGTVLQEQHYGYVNEALVCIDEEVRSEALFLLCNTLKRATPVSSMEIELLKSFINVNLKTDSTSFRQNMVSALKKLVTRIRDSCLSEVRSQKSSSSDVLKNGIDFIDWFFNTLLQNLYPGGTYQCRQTTLDLLEATLSLLVFQEQHCAKKGKAQEGVEILVEFANNSGKWMFFSEQNFLILLLCLEDGSDDIQNQCYKLLMEFFPWPNSLQWNSNQKGSYYDLDSQDSQGNAEKSLMTIMTKETTVCNLMNKALYLTSSPKSYENHTGLLLMSLLFKKYVENIGLSFEFDSHCQVSKICSDSGNPNCKLHPSYAFLNMLMHFLETSVSAARQDPGGQFKLHPIHGLTRYTTQCLQEILKNGDGINKSENERIRYLQRLNDLNKSTINLMLEILSGGGNLDQCPSFAEMGVALESLISVDEENQENLTTLSPDFQLLLSWCWINLKESCTSLGQVAASALKADKCFLSSSAISEIGDVFVRVLTTCRHRGAIEGCRSGFSQFCEVLLSSKFTEYSSIPKSMLTTIIHSLQSNSLTASISRRSAGLPIIVEIVIYQVIKTCHDKQYLISTVDEFYTIAAQPLTSDHNQQRDLAQVHAFNILKAVFCDANLASHLGPLLSKLTILVIENFDSPSWAIRNAATQLISTLVMRIFGQRNKDNGSMTLEEFNNLHPELVEYITLKLQDLRSKANVINPSLYVLLTLLSNLVMASSHVHDFENRQILQSLLSSYLENPVYSLRNLSAKASIALFQLNQADQELHNLLTDLVHTKQNLNSLHGRLLRIHHLISSDALSNNTLQTALTFFCDHKLLFTPSPSCFLPSTQAVLILQQLVRRFHGDFPKQMCTLLWSHLECLFSLLCKHNDKVQFGSATCMREGFMTMTLIVAKCQDLQTVMAKFVCTSIKSSNRDLSKAVISTLHKEPLQEYMKDPAIQETLWHSLVKESSSSIFVQSSDILFHLFDHERLKSDVPQDLSLQCCKELMDKWSHIDSAKSSILMLAGIAYNSIGSSDLIMKCDMIQQWCDGVFHFSRPFMNENLRLSAARALRKGGEEILDLCKNNPTHNVLGNVAVSIIKATIHFLEDSETNVRNEASVFVSNLMSIPQAHSNLAFNMLSKYITQHLCGNYSILAFLLEELHVRGDLTKQCKIAYSTGSQRLFEPETESILLEVHAKKIWAFQTLKNISGSSGSKMLVHLKVKSSEAACDLQENISQLTFDLKNSLFNASNRPKVMGSLLGMLLLDRLCQNVSVADDLHKLVGNLLQVRMLRY